jgi:hypothetical protein
LFLGVGLDCELFGLFDFRVLVFEGVMVEFPLSAELVEFLAVSGLSNQCFIVFLEFGDAFVFGHHFLEVAAALGGCSSL